MEVTVQQLREKLNLSKNTFDSWRRRGKLEGAFIRRERRGRFWTSIYDFEKAQELIGEQRRFVEESRSNYKIPGVKEAQPQEVQKDNSSGEEKKGPTITQSKAISAAYEAQLKKIEYEEKIGKLISRIEVEKKLSRMARTILQSLMSIPGRVAGEITGMKEEKEVEALLKKEIEESLRELVKIAKPGVDS